MKKKFDYSYLLKNTLLFTIANFANKLILFFLLPFYTAYLTTEEYAVIDLITITQQLIFPLITLDMTEAVIRFGIEEQANKKIVFSIGFLFVTAGNLLLLIISCAAIGLQLWKTEFVVYFMLLSVVISFQTLLSAYLRTLDKIKILTVASIINTAVMASLNILLTAKMGLGISGYFTAVILGNMISIVILILSIKIKGFLYKIDAQEFRRYGIPMLKYAVPMIPNSIFWWMNSSLDRYFLTLFGTLASVGMYAAANKIPSLLVTITSVFQQAWSLSLFKEHKAEFFISVFRIYNRLHLAVSVILILSVKFVCRLLLGGEFFEAWVWVPWLVIGFYSNAVSSFIGTEFTAAKRTSWIVVTTLLSAAVNLVLNWLWIPVYGGLGAALATCLSCFVLCEIRVLLLRYLFAIRLDNKMLCFSHTVIVGIAWLVCGR